MATPSLFLSFSSRDAGLATALREGLQQRGLVVWKAPECIPPGVEWATAIDAGIAQQPVFLLLWSEAAMASAEVSKEISLAASVHRRLLLPVRLTSSLPQGGQAYHLTGIQWLEGQGQSPEVLVDRIAVRVRELLESGIQPPAIPPRPAARQDARHRRRLLLFQGLVGVLSVSAVAFDLVPTLPPHQWLLDQRLFWQARWRQLTGQGGPLPPPIGLLPLSLPVYQELGVKPTEGSVNQAVLARALAVLPPAGPPQRVGLDFILDGPGANPAGHALLAQVIRQQRGQRQVWAGLCPPNSVATAACLKAGDQRLAGLLAAAGARSVSLGLGLRTETQAALMLVEAVGQGSLAAAMATAAPRGALPDDAVIDWSVNWLAPQRLRVLNNRQALALYRGPALLVASDGYGGSELQQVADQHPAPRAVWAYQGEGAERFATTLQRGTLPGGALQAVLAQSISSGHWLVPVSPFMHTLSTALGAGVGWWLGAVGGRRRRWAVGAGAAMLLVYGALAMQLAVSWQRLLPLALPLAAAGGVAMLRPIRRQV